jgi:hypothetical protein
MTRADAVNVHPRFIDALADAVTETFARYRSGLPLSFVGDLSVRLI